MIASAEDAILYRKDTPWVKNILNIFDKLTPEFSIQIRDEKMIMLVPIFTQNFKIQINKMENSNNCFGARWKGAQIMLGNHPYLFPTVGDLMWIKSRVNWGVKVIQKQYRLWKWRRDILWNPHTEIGRLNLLLEYNLTII